MSDHVSREVLSSPLNLSLLILLFTILITSLTYSVFPLFKYKVLSLVSVACVAYILGRLYGRFVRKKPSKIFRKVTALYYILFSRVWIIILSIIFIDLYTTDLLNTVSLSSMIAFSLASLFITFFLIYFLFEIGANAEIKKLGPPVPNYILSS